MAPGPRLALCAGRCYGRTSCMAVDRCRKLPMASRPRIRTLAMIPAAAGYPSPRSISLNRRHFHRHGCGRADRRSRIHPSTRITRPGPLPLMARSQRAAQTSNDAAAAGIGAPHGPWRRRGRGPARESARARCGALHDRKLDATLDLAGPGAIQREPTHGDTLGLQRGQPSHDICELRGSERRCHRSMSGAG